MRVSAPTAMLVRASMCFTVKLLTLELNSTKHATFEEFMSFQAKMQAAGCKEVQINIPWERCLVLRKEGVLGAEELDDLMHRRQRRGPVPGSHLGGPQEDVSTSPGHHYVDQTKWAMKDATPPPKSCSSAGLLWMGWK